MNGLPDRQNSGNDWTVSPAQLWQEDYQLGSSDSSSGHRHVSRSQFARHIQQQLEEQMAQFEANHEAAVLDLQKGYVFVNEPAIRNFFISHRTAPGVLLEALPHLRRSFTAGTIFNLRASVDEYRANTLYAVALWPGPVQDARVALNRFDDWWIANSRQASGDLCFTYELI